MGLQKTDVLTIRVNQYIKRKFEIACRHSNQSAVILEFMNSYIRDFERDYGIIPVSTDDSVAYEFLKQTMGLKINDKKLEELKLKYPKTRKGLFIK